MKIIIIFILLVISTSCNNKNDYLEKDLSENKVIKVNGSKTSTNIDSLGIILDFSKYKPIKVQFKYSNYNLEALLYFDSLTMEKFYEFDRNADYSSPNYDKELFNFEWLPTEIVKELEDSNLNYEGHPDFFFSTGKSRKSWYLNNKILIINQKNE